MGNINSGTQNVSFGLVLKDVEMSNYFLFMSTKVFKCGLIGENTNKIGRPYIDVFFPILLPLPG